MLNLDVAQGNVRPDLKIGRSKKKRVPHTLTNGKDPTSGKLFDTSIINGGSTAQVLTAKLSAGDCAYHWSIHTYMTGLVKV